MSKFMEDELRAAAPSFSQALFSCIDAKGMTDVEVYKRARIDRKLFSKIRNGHAPKKITIIALALSLKLNYSETIDLLNLAGYTLSPSCTLPFDVIIASSINNGIYDIDTINETLYRYKLPLIGE